MHIVCFFYTVLITHVTERIESVSFLSGDRKQAVYGRVRQDGFHIDFCAVLKDVVPISWDPMRSHDPKVGKTSDRKREKTYRTHIPVKTF